MYSCGIPVWAAVMVIAAGLVFLCLWLVTRRQLLKAEHENQKLLEDLRLAAEPGGRRAPVDRQPAASEPPTSGKPWNAWSNWLTAVLLVAIVGCAIAMVVVLSHR